nr:nuclear transport factor 2 family protein [Sphingobium sp. JAI105]
MVAIEEIKQLKARYFRCVDGKDWDGFRAVFAADAAFDISNDRPGCILIGPDSIAEAASTPLTGCISIHHGHCPEIEVISETTATGIWAMEDMLRWDAQSARPNRTLHGYGHYHETYVKQDGGWRIQSLKLVRLRVDHGVWEGD